MVKHWFCTGDFEKLKTYSLLLHPKFSNICLSFSRSMQTKDDLLVNAANNKNNNTIITYYNHLSRNQFYIFFFVFILRIYAVFASNTTWIPIYSIQIFTVVVHSYAGFFFVCLSVTIRCIFLVLYEKENKE